jgi:hypothetical protein
LVTPLAGMTSTASILAEHHSGMNQKWPCKPALSTQNS